MRFNDAIIGAVLVVFAIAEIAYARTFPSLFGQNYGPDLFPTIIGLGLLACGLVLIYSGLVARRSSNAVREHASIANWADLSAISSSNAARINALLIVLIPLVYILFSDTIGFALLSVTSIALLIYRMGSSILVALMVAVSATAVIQVLFAKVLLVPLPSGWLQGFI